MIYNTLVQSTIKNILYVYLIGEYSNHASAQFINQSLQKPAVVCVMRQEKGDTKCPFCLLTHWSHMFYEFLERTCPASSSCENYQQTYYNLAAVVDPVHAYLLLASIRADFPKHFRIFISRQHHRYKYFINPFILYIYVAILNEGANRLPILWKSSNK